MQDKVQIRSIGFIIPSLGSGGAERVVAILAEGLTADYDVHILIEDAAATHFPVKKAKVHVVPMTYEGILAAVIGLKINMILDHYHWSQDHVRILSRLADTGLPIVLTEHNAWHYPLFQWGRNTQPGYDQWFTDRYAHYAKFAAVTVLNDTAFRYFSQHLDNVRTIPNPVPPPGSRRSDPGSQRILTVSHFRKKAKRLDLMYQAFAALRTKVPEAALTVLGDYDALQDAYCRKAAGLEGVAIETPGRSSLVDHHFDRAALFAMTSEIEGQPMVLLEAAQHGLPQIAFDLPGLDDQILHGETGLLVPFGDTQAFADAAAELLGDEPRLRRMGAAAKAFVRSRFALPRILGQWRQLISDIAEKGRIRSSREALPARLVQADADWQAYWRRLARNDEGDTAPKVSFLVPVFGTEELLPRCLRSIQRQTLTDFECIIVDDASPGDVQGTVRATVGDDARFRIIEHSRNRGLYQARSTAAELARGLYLAHVDSDDYVHPRFAEILFAEAITTGAEIVECQAVELHEDGRPIRFNSIVEMGPVDGDQAARAFFANRIRNVLWNKLYARDLWNRVPGHMQIDRGLSICEDLLRNSFLFPACRRYSAVEDCLYSYCRRPNSVVKGGDFGRLLAKLADIDLAYGMAKTQVQAPSQGEAWLQLEARRVEDVNWYVAEYLGRTDFSVVRAELRRREGQIDPNIATILHLVRARAEARDERANAVRALKHEQSRAKRLEERLAELRHLMEG